MIFGNQLKELRIENEFTQNQVADKLMVSRSTIGKYETGAAYPDFEKLIAISNLFKCSTDYLLGISSSKNVYSEVQLNFFESLINLSISEGIAPTENNEVDFKILYEQIKLSFKIIDMLKRIALKNDTILNK